MGANVSFFGPSALLWLIPLAGFIVGLYLLRMRRREMRVPASFLWPERVEEIRANSLFQKLRFSWLLVLQLLAALLVCAALARPQILQRGLTGRSTVIVIDSSLTMGATDERPSRLELAKAKAREIVNAAAPGEKLAVIEAGSAPEIVSPLANDPVGQIRAIDSVRQSDAPPTVGEALRIASALVGSNSSGRIVLLSDGEFGNVANFSPGQARLAFETIGRSSDNLAVTALGVSETKRGREIYCAVRNSGLQSAHANVNVFSDGSSIHSEPIDVPGRGQWSGTFDGPANASLFEAKLEAEDFLSADNYMAVSAEKGATLHVLLLTSEDPFTEKALSLDPRVNLDRSDEVPQSELSERTARYDLIVFDGLPEVPVATRNVLVLGSATSSQIVQAQGSSAHPRALSQTKDPLLDAVDLSQVNVVSSQSLASAKSEVLASASNGPELLRVRGLQRRIYLSFQPLKSDFPLKPAYPIFISHCLDFFGKTTGTGPLVVHPGVPFALQASQSVRVTDPNGQSNDIPSHGGLATIRGLDRVGRYSLTIDGKHRDLYCSLDGRVVEIKPIPEVTAGGAHTLSSAAALSSVDVWRYVALGLLAVLVFEWLLYARRS
jgi:hypothetical protein